MKAAAFALAVAASPAEVFPHLAAGAKPLAGGQSLGPMLNLRLARPPALVDVSRILRGAVEEADSVIYWASVTHAEIEDGRVPDATPGWLARVAGGIAYRAVRNRGTMGGSLAHADPAADWLVVLTALRAEILATGPAGTRRLAMPDFITAPFTTALSAGEMITAIRVPRPKPGARFGYWKLQRKPGEFAKASAAVLLDGGVRIAVGALEAPPLLLDDPAGLPDGLPMHRVAIERAMAAAR